MSFALGLVVKPLALILLFGFARLAGWAILRITPDGKFKRWLMTERGGF